MTSIRIILLSLTAALGGFLFGFDSGVINGTVDALQKAFGSDALGTGFNVASLLLGCAVGAFCAGTLADRFGRKPVMLATAIIFIVNAWGSGSAGSSFEFVCFRMLGGLAVGAASVLCPAYISEIAPARVRGRLASLQQLMVVLGLFCSFLSNYLLARAAGGPGMALWGFHAWQWMYWMQIVPAGIFLFSLFLIPESPRYLVSAGKLREAAAVLKGVGHRDDAEEKVEEIRHSLKGDHHPRLGDLIDHSRRRLHSVVSTGIGLAAFQQLVGINVVFYYGAVLWKAAGFSENDALFTNVIIAAINIGSTFVAMAIIDRIGRKPLLIVGSIGMTVTLGLLAAIFGSAAVMESGYLHLNPREGLWALIIANLYVFFFSASWGPVMWVLLGEMFPNRIRGVGVAIGGSFAWITNFIITMTFPIFLARIGLGGAYAFYAAAAGISAIFVWKFVSETRGKRLEEMQMGSLPSGQSGNFKAANPESRC